MWKLWVTLWPIPSTLTVFSGVFDSVVAADWVFDPFMESSLSCNLKLKKFAQKSFSLEHKKLSLPNVSIKSVRWCMQQMIFTHLTDPRVFAICITVKFALEAVILNLSCCFAKVLVHLFMTYRMFNFYTGLAGTRTLKEWFNVKI